MGKSEIISSIVGFILGILATFLTDWLKKRLLLNRIRRIDKKSHKGIFNYNPEDDDLYVINRWSLERKLTPSSLQIVVSVKPLQPYIPEADLEIAIEQQKILKRSGDICYLTDFSIDHRESEHGRKFFMQISPCDYAEHMAAFHYMQENHDVLAAIRNAIKTSPKAYVNNAVPSNITVNAIILSENNFLACQRSNVVDTAHNLWGVGVFETMTLRKGATSTYDEDLFALTRRALWEEAKLSPDCYGEILITWFGLYVENARTHIVSVVKIKNLSEGQALNLAANAHSNFETKKIEWLPMDVTIANDWIKYKSNILSDREWMPFTALSLQEAFRVKDFL